MKQAIVTCVTANWIPAAAVTLMSCAENGKATDADLVICVDGASAADHRKIEEFNSLHGLNIMMLDADTTAFNNAELGAWGVGAVMRLNLDQYLSRDYDRVLYLDSDILALAPLQNLLNTDLEDKIIAAVPDVGFLGFVMPKLQRRMIALGLEGNGDYFNSGVMLFNWNETLRQGILAQTRAVLNTNKTLESPDQDALNLVLKNRWKALDYRWNVAGLERLYLNLAPFVVHFTGRKPWSARRSSKDRKYFRYYEAKLRESPWPQFVSKHLTLAAIRIDIKHLFKAAVHPLRRKQLRDYLKSR